MFFTPVMDENAENFYAALHNNILCAAWGGGGGGENSFGNLRGAEESV